MSFHANFFVRRSMIDSWKFVATLSACLLKFNLKKKETAPFCELMQRFIGAHQRDAAHFKCIAVEVDDRRQTNRFSSTRPKH